MTRPDPFPPDATAVALGRHALGLVARALRRRGVGQVVIPDYHCLTMVLPFQLEGFRVAGVAVGPDLMADPAELASVVGEHPDHWALLHTDVFGADPTPELRAVVARLRARGMLVIRDATHRWPRPSQVQADYEVASIRKLLGLPDGAYVTGLPSDIRPASRGEVDHREERAWLAGDIEQAEDLMDQQLTPVGPSAFTLERLGEVDLAALVAAREATARRLSAAVDDLGFHRLSPADAHFCVAFRHPRGAELVVELARRGVDGPVWWPRPGGWSRPWPDDVVTLPLDAGSPRFVLDRLAELLAR